MAWGTDNEEEAFQEFNRIVGKKGLQMKKAGTFLFFILQPS